MTEVTVNGHLQSDGGAVIHFPKEMERLAHVSLCCGKCHCTARKKQETVRERQGKAWLLQAALISLEDISESCTGLETSPIIIMTHS